MNSRPVVRGEKYSLPSKPYKSPAWKDGSIFHAMTQKRKPIESTPKHYFCLEWITLIVIQENSSNRKHQKKKHLVETVFSTYYLAILCDLSGMVKWPSRKVVGDLQLGDRKVTAWITWYLNHPKNFPNAFFFVQNHPPPAATSPHSAIRHLGLLFVDTAAWPQVVLFLRKHPPSIQWLEVATTFRSSPSHTVDGAQIRWSLTSWGW